MMKYTALLSLLFCSTQALQATTIIPCDGDYAASQKWLSDIAGTTIQGHRGLGSISVKVLKCGNTMRISADGMTMSLERVTNDSNIFKGNHEGTPNLNFTLEAVTARHIKGTMIASDGELTLKRPLAVILESGKAPSLKSCDHETEKLIRNQQDISSLIALFKILKLSPASGFEYLHYIHEKVTSPKGRSELSFYLNGKNEILPKISKQRLAEGFCEAKGSPLSIPKTRIDFVIQQTSSGADITLKVIDISAGEKLLQEHKAQANEYRVETVTKAMDKSWKQLDPSISIMTMSNGK